MPNVTANGIQIEYETFGDSSSPPLILIMGLSAQMIFWYDEFCRLLADRGHYVIRFDNRDVGLSTKLEKLGVPNIMEVMTAALQGEKVDSPYTLDDMADDSVGLLDSLGIDRAHVCGASMGGMIAQTVAYRHPSRVLSLTSIMSSTGNPELPQPKPEAMEALITPAPVEREANIEHGLKVWKIIGSPGFPFEEELVRDVLTRSYERCFYPQGMVRQMTAIVAHGNRKTFLGSITAPTLVIHGGDDPLVPVEGGKDTAQAIPGSDLLIIDGMGHDLPRQAWTRMVDAIAGHTKKAAA